MKTGFYPKLAFDGIRKNRRMYVPFICTCIGMVMMFYIISYLHYSDSVAAMRGGAIVQTMLNLGTITVGIFSCIFLFYTNASFNTSSIDSTGIISKPFVISELTSSTST